MLVFDCMEGFIVLMKAELDCSCWAMSGWSEIVHCVVLEFWMVKFLVWSVFYDGYCSISSFT